MNIAIHIHNQEQQFIPVVEDGVSLEWERKGTPGKLTFKVNKAGTLGFYEGNPVKLLVDGSEVFAGYIFTKKRNKDGWITVTAYDQLRYFKNKDTYQYKNLTASQVVNMIAEDFGLICGDIEDTGYTIDARLEEDETLFDIVQNALDLTLDNRGEIYVLYDGCGKICLKNIGNMKLDLLIKEDTAEDFDYSTSIDKNTYNQIKLTYDNEETGKREIFIARDGGNIEKWGVLQYFESLNNSANAVQMADSLLSLYNQKTRELTIKNAFGDVRVRGGSLIMVYLNLGDMVNQSYMMVEKVKHSFSGGMHTMDLTLRGGDFIA